MKIYLTRDKSQENSRYIVYSETGQVLYKIVGKRKSSVERTYIMKDDACVAKIRDAHLGPIRTCYVTEADLSFHLVFTTVNNKTSITFHGLSFHLRGDLLFKSYDLLNIDNSVVACVCRRFNSSADALEININDKNFELACISTAVCLDSVCTMDSMALQAT
ncbi:MAG: hypothetical protein IJD68_06990 [Ruminococcus sp.]|nr:hypothetical protein [Ruminococcus sp.]